MAPVKVSGKRNAAVNCRVLSQTDLNRVYLQGDYKSSKILFFFGDSMECLGQANLAPGENMQAYFPGEMGFVRRGFSLDAGGGIAAVGFARPAVTGAATEVPPSAYAFFTKPSAACCAPPVSPLVCFALLYSLTARSRCPNRSKIFPR